MAGTDTSAQQAAEQACDRLQLVVPDEIRRYKQWVLWRYEPGDDKPRKVPYYANGSRRSGVQGSESDLAQLSTFDAAVAKLRRSGFDGVGLAILPNSPIKAIDLDACVVNGKLLTATPRSAPAERVCGSWRSGCCHRRRPCTASAQASI